MVNKKVKCSFHFPKAWKVEEKELAIKLGLDDDSVFYTGEKYKKQWTPKQGQRYWSLELSTTNDVGFHIDWEYCDIDDVDYYIKNLKIGNVFRTKKEVKTMVKKFEKLLKEDK